MMQRSDHHDTDPQVLAGRLNTGWVMCERETDSSRKERLEEHWLRLLHEYEDVCDRTARQPVSDVKGTVQ